MSRAPAILLHLCAASIMTYGYLGLHTTAINAWLESQTGGHFQFLTIQGLAVAWLTMITSLLCDLWPSSAMLRPAKRALLMIALPLSVVISSIYWTLITFLPALIVPSNPETSEPSSAPDLAIFRIPLLIDLALHAAPALSLLADFFLFESRYTNSEAKYGASVVTALFCVWYCCWVEYCASHNGSFPYPFLNHPFNIRLCVYVGASILAVVSFRAINQLHAKDAVYHAASSNGATIKPLQNGTHKVKKQS